MYKVLTYIFNLFITASSYAAAGKGGACQTVESAVPSVTSHYTFILPHTRINTPPSLTRPAADNLQHPGHYLHRGERPEAALPGPALRPLLQRPQSPQHGRRGPRQHQGERQRAAGGRRAGQPGRGAHHHLGASGDVHHLHRDHHHPVHHHHQETALAPHHSGTAAVY